MHPTLVFPLQPNFATFPLRYITGFTLLLALVLWRFQKLLTELEKKNKENKAAKAQ